MRDFKGIIAYTCFLCFIWLAVSLIDNCPGMDFGKLSEKHLKAVANSLFLFLLLKAYV